MIYPMLAIIAIVAVCLFLFGLISTTILGMCAVFILVSIFISYKIAAGVVSVLLIIEIYRNK